MRGPINTEVPAAFKPLWEPKRFKIMYGGRGGGKSVSVAKTLLIMGYQGRKRILCTREVQKSLDQSVIRLLGDLVRELGLDWFYEVQKSSIVGKNGTEFVFAGLQNHTVDTVRSYSKIDIVWVEEAHSVSARSWEVMVPTIREEGSEIWATFNPESEEDEVYRRFVLLGDPDAWVCKVNYYDNPWFPEVLEAERLKLKAVNEDLYRHVWEGECRSLAGLLFKRDWFKFYDVLPSRLNLYLASDYGVTPDEGDHTEHGVFGLSPTGELYAVDWWYGQTDPAEWIDAWLGLIATHKPLVAFEEKGVILRAVDSAINRRMLETQTFVGRKSLVSAGSKAERALGFAARASAGAVYLPAGKPWAIRLLNQLCSFTGEDGRQDDAVDVCSLIGRGLDSMSNAGLPWQEQAQANGEDYGVDDEDEDGWKVA